MTSSTVFISYSHKNKDWVRNWLLSKIESHGLKAHIDYRDFEIGTPSLINMERAVEQCAKTILVFTPDWINSEWSQFEGLMLMIQDPIGLRKRILPLMLIDCELPTRLKIFTFADFREKEEWEFQFERMISQIKKDFATLAPEPLKYPPLSENNIDIMHLPRTGFELFGRQTELFQLDQAWESAKINVISFVAYGGVGKTTLVNKWVEKMRWDNYRGARKVYAWSFYSQGTSERVTSADLFIAEALKWFGDPNPTQGSPWNKGLHLADLVRKEKTLLLLDGMEPLQSHLDFERGKIKDPALAVLVTELARENPGLCIITTRESVIDLTEFAETTKQIDLEQISAEAGRALLRVGGVQGTDAELEKTAHDFGLHALALNLLSAYIHEIPGHHVSSAAEIPEIDVSLKEGKHPRRVMSAFANQFGDSAEVELLRILGLFSSPAAREEIVAVRAAPPIPDLSEHLQTISETEWIQLVNRLRRLKLIAAESRHRLETLDAHPLVREHFGKQLKQEYPNAWREGNNRLYEYYKSSAKEFPNTVEEMAPLYAAVLHGCQAERYQEAFIEIYMGRIQRGERYFNLRELGAFGADLAILSGFFSVPWHQPVTILGENEKGLVLNFAGAWLRALGRLEEATQPMVTALETRIALKFWPGATTDASNLSQLYLIIGDVKQALNYARQSVELADRSGNAFHRMSKRATLATALHQEGRFAEAEVKFRESEEIEKLRPHVVLPLLVSFSGFLYCDLLLDQDKYQDVQSRATQTLELAKQQLGLLSTALDYLSLGRAHLLQSQYESNHPLTEAGIYLNHAVDSLRKSGEQIWISRGLLARAELHRAIGTLDKARKDLDEAFTIATRGGMGLHLADGHLEYSRLHIETFKRSNVQTNLEEARKHLATAKEMIEKMGYHRRDTEVAELEKQLS